jgi:hypothetical protein
MLGEGMPDPVLTLVLPLPVLCLLLPPLKQKGGSQHLIGDTSRIEKQTVSLAGDADGLSLVLTWC